jgi:2-polyprenyl-3-methyl-5-hydroxy-6-metoxy-1,4-benzoquinol methylase
MANNETLVSIYDRNAPDMENVSPFYEWAMGVFNQYQVPYDASIIDIGCGTGAVIARLYKQGYRNLTGVDFSPGCLRLAAAKGLPICLSRHDIVEEPLSEEYDAVLMTGVIDLVTNPRAALRNVRVGLKEQGLFFISIRNLTAYFPWYHLRFLARKLERWPRAKHWFLHFTTPLSMRRNEYPVDEMFTASQARDLLRDCGFEIVGEHSAQILPMLWIWDLTRLVRMMQWIDGRVGSPGVLGYRYMFVCKKRESEG